MNVIVTGGAGWLGRRICYALARKKCRVTVIDLGSIGEGPWDCYSSIDISKDESVESFGVPTNKTFEALIHCAGYAHRPIETPDEVERFFAINRDGSQRVIRLAEKLGVERVVYLSSIAFYDWEQGCDFNEQGPLAQKTAYAASKLAGEDAFRNSSLDWRVARLGTIYGDGDRANFSKLAGAMANKRFLIPGKGTARKSVLPVGLAAELLVELALMKSPKHRLLNLALPETPTLKKICKGFADECGFTTPPSIPLPVFRMAALAGNAVARVKPSFPLTQVNLRKLTTSTSVDVTRMLETFPDREWGTFADYLRKDSEYYRGLTPK